MDRTQRWRTRHPDKILLQNLRQRAPDAELDESWVRKKLAAGVCEVSGIAFQIATPGEGKNPFSPSIDRIDRTKGYTFQNCRMVVFIFNLARNSWKDSDVLLLAEALVRRRAENMKAK